MNDVAGNEIGAGAVGRSNRSSILLGKEPTVSTAGLLTDPEQDTFPQGEPAGEGQIDKESVGLQVMNHVPAVVARVLGAPHVGPRRLSAEVGEQPRPPRADQKQRRTAGDAGRFGHLPSVDQAVVVEKLNAELCRSSAGEVELTDLEGVQVAVVVEGLQDGTVSLGECSEKLTRLLLGERSGGVLGK